MKQIYSRGIAGILAVLLTVGLLGGCKAKEAVAVTDALQMNDAAYTIGVPTGATAMMAVESALPKAKVQHYNSLADAYLAVQQGKVDAFAFDRYLLQFTMANGLGGVKILDGTVGESDIVGIGISRKTEIPDLQGKINAALETLSADGTLDEMFQRWVIDANHTMPNIPKPQSPTIKLQVATSGTIQPFSYYEGDKLTGYDLELTARLALLLNAEVELKIYDYTGFSAAMEAGAIDCVLANLNATEERKETMDFSTALYTTETALLVRGDAVPNGEKVPLETARYGAMIGSTGEQFIMETYPEVRLDTFQSSADAFTALESNKVDYVVTGYTICLNAVRTNPKLVIYKKNLHDQAVAMAVAKGNSQLLGQLNERIKAYQADGTMEEMTERWIREDGEYNPTDIPVAEGKNGKLRVATPANQEPYTFVMNGKCRGLSCELIERIAYDLDMKVEYQNMQFSSLIAALSSGKADVICASMAVTKERQEMADFTEGFINEPLTMVSNIINPPMQTQEEQALAGQSAGGEYTAISQMDGKTIGVQSGAIFDMLVSEVLPNTKFNYYNGRADIVEALKGGKVDGVALDKPVAELAAAQSPSLTVIPEKVQNDSYGVCLPKGSPLTAEVNNAIAQLRADGTLDAMSEKWTGADESVKTLPEITYAGANGVLRVVHDPTLEPMSYVGANGAAGYDLEMMLRVGEILDRKIEFTQVDFGALIPMLQSGKAEAAVGCMSITDERKQSVDMSDAYYDGGVYLVVRKATEAVVSPQELGFIEGIRKSFIRTFVVEDRWKLVLDGLVVTVLLSVCSGILGSIMGFGICMLRRSKHRGISIPMAVVIRIVQGTPIVVLLMILYYIIFGSVDVSAIAVAIFGFSLNFGVYVSEMMRTGIDAVDKGQIEAAYAIGLTRMQAFWKITFPQAARHFLPVFEGEFISMVKMTSVVGYIAIQDLTKVSDIIRSRTLEAFFPLIATAVIYFMVANVLILLISHFKNHLDPKRFKRTVKGVVTK